MDSGPPTHVTANEIARALDTTSELVRRAIKDAGIPPAVVVANIPAWELSTLPQIRAAIGGLDRARHRRKGGNRG